jgi:hypothetical protein
MIILVVCLYFILVLVEMCKVHFHVLVKVVINNDLFGLVFGHQEMFYFFFPIDEQYHDTYTYDIYHLFFFLHDF